MAYILYRAAKGDLQSAPSNALSADIGSLSLEFTRLSQLSGDPKYYDAIQRIMNAFEESQNTTRLPGMWPVSLNARKLDFTNDRVFTLGAMADSLYEYFPKVRSFLAILIIQALRSAAISSAQRKRQANPEHVSKKYGCGQGTSFLQTPQSW